MLRRLIKTGIARAFHSSGADVLAAFCTGARGVPLVVGYHRVVEDFGATSAHSIPAMLVSARTLEHHLDWIGRRFDFVTLDEVVSRLEEKRGFGKPAAAVTFDDGYADVYHHAFPLLKKKGIPAAVFVVTDLVGTTRLQIHDELYLLFASAFRAWRPLRRRLAGNLLGLGISPGVVANMGGGENSPFRATRALLEALPQAQLQRVIAALKAEAAVHEPAVPEPAKEGFRPLSWEMLSEMHCAGVTIGSHTRTHAVLTNETWQKTQSEIEESRQAAERGLGIPVRHFSYPDGRFNAATVRAVEAAGYRGAYTTCPHRDPGHPLLTIPRRLFWERSCVDAHGQFSPAVMSCQVRGVFDFMKECRQDHRLGAFPRPSAAAS